MIKKIILTLLLPCFLLTGCNNDGDSTRQPEGNPGEVNFVVTRGPTNPYPDDTTFGFTVYDNLADTEPSGSASDKTGTYRYHSDPAQHPYGNADHLSPCMTDGAGEIDYNLYPKPYNILRGIRVKKGTSYVYMTMPGILPENKNGSIRIKYTRDILLQAATEPFVINANDYDGPYEVALSPATKMQTIMAKFNFNFIQGDDQPITVSDVSLVNVGTAAYYHPKTRVCLIEGQGSEPASDLWVPIQSTGTNQKDKVSYKNTTPSNIFPADYSGGDETGAKTLSLQFKLEKGGMNTVILLPVTVLVLPNKIYDFNITVTSIIVDLSFTFRAWEDEPSNGDIGSESGKKINLGSFVIGNWDNGNENNQNQKDDII